MAILIDPPLWPAHGMLWSHLVSDESYDELHDFARATGLARRSFDLDHYDVAERHVERLIAAGATYVDPRDLVRRLQASGLRVRQRDRETVRPIRREAFLTEGWISVGTRLSSSGRLRGGAEWREVGEVLLQRWSEPHRAYHTPTHLEDVLLALDQLSTHGETITVETELAAWFHDAVYTGRGDADERESAALAERSLVGVGVDPLVAKLVADLILTTVPGTDAPPPDEARQLLDADLAIFAAPTSRYDEYTQAVRHEYAHVPEPLFREGRASILESYLAREHIYATAPARGLWEGRARANLLGEIEKLYS